MSEDKTQSKGFGGRLRAEREAREITLEEISRVTKVSIHMLHAMERDDWDALPGGIFTRNFIRLYANHLGLNAERWVDEYRHFEKTRRKADEPETETQKEEKKVSSSSDLPQGMLWAIIIFTLIVLVGGYFVISYLRSGTSGAKNTGVEQNSTGAVRQANTENGTSVSSDSVIVTDDIEWEGLTVELLETRTPTCWISVSADGERISPSDGENLTRGTARTFRADSQLSFLIAHIDSVELAVNGHKLGWDEVNTRRIEDAEGNVSYSVDIDLNQLDLSN